MEKRQDFKSIVSALKKIHPNYKKFLDEFLSKIQSIWMGRQDKTKSHFINLLGLESKAEAERVLYDVLKALGWIRKDFFKLQIHSCDYSEPSAIVHMMLSNGGFAPVTYFPEAEYWMRNYDSDEKVARTIKMELNKWFKSRVSLQVLLAGKTYQTLSNGNLVINWFGFSNHSDILDKTLDLMNFGLDHHDPYQKEVLIQLPLHRDQLIHFYLKEIGRCSDALDPKEFVFFLKDKDNFIDFRNSLLEVRTQFEAKASREIDLPIQCRKFLDLEFFDRWIPDLSNVDGLKSSYWDFLMTGFDFLKRTRRDFDSKMEKISINFKGYWMLTIYWENAGKFLSGNGHYLVVHEFDFPLFPKEIE